MSRKDLDYDAWCVKQRAEHAEHYEDHWLGLELTDEDRANLEADLPRRWQEVLKERAERDDRYRRKFLSAMPRRAAEVAIATIGDISPEADAFYEQNVVTGKGGMLVLNGPTGTGKTTEACRLGLRYTLDTGWTFTFVRAAELAACSRYNGSREKYLEATHLLIDDLGSEYSDKSGSWLADLDELIDRQYANRGTVIITTNVPRTAFARRYDERIADRLRECGTWVTMAGESKRGRK